MLLRLLPEYRSPSNVSSELFGAKMVGGLQVLHSGAKSTTGTVGSSFRSAQTFYANATHYAY
jgi:hypothetical protein